VKVKFVACGEVMADVPASVRRISWRRGHSFTEPDRKPILDSISATRSGSRGGRMVT
jgi:hypothetical protein